jgi:AMP nucleosidase
MRVEEAKGGIGKKEVSLLVTTVDDIPGVIEQLCAVYDESVANLRSALSRYLADGEKPDPRDRAKGVFAYPELRIDFDQMLPTEFPSRAYGRLNHPGRYATSIARPQLFRKYLSEQLERW